MQQVVNTLRVGGLSLDRPQKWERIIWTRVVPFLVLVNIALNPFPHTTSIREISYYGAVALFAFYFLRYRDWSVFNTPFTLPVALFTGWSFVGLFWALDVGASLHDIRSHLLKYIVFFLLLTVFFNSRAKIRLLFWVIIVSVMLSGLHDMYFFYMVDKNSCLSRMAIPNHQLPVGPLGFMAVFAGMLAVHLLRTGKSFWERFGLIVCVVGLLLIFFATQMRSLLIALPFVFVALFWDNKKILVSLIVVLLIFSYIFFTKLRALDDVYSYTDRLTINIMSLMIIKGDPIAGIGFSMETPGNHDLIDHEVLRMKIPEKFRHDTVEYNNPHNMWLGLAVRLGLVGLSFFAGIFIVGGRICLATISQYDNREMRLAGQLCLAFLFLFSVYGIFNEVFMHLLEMLLTLVFAIIAGLMIGSKKYDKEIVDAVP